MAGKTKIELFEEEIIATELTDERLETFRKLLVRAGSDYNRNQHCYITAYKFPAERLEESVKLIKFGIQTYKDDNSGMMRAYDTLAAAYERAGQYQTAYDLYVKLYSEIKTERFNFPWCLLRTRLHIDSFKYTEEAERYYNICTQQDSFSKSLLNNRFWLLVAQTIIERHNGNTEEAKRCSNELNQIITPGHKGPLHSILAKHRIEESVTVSKECRKYLAELNKTF